MWLLPDLEPNLTLVKKDLFVKVLLVQVGRSNWSGGRGRRGNDRRQTNEGSAALNG
jgi:hypothetical protein